MSYHANTINGLNQNDENNIVYLPWFSADESDADVLFDDGECICGNIDWCGSELCVESMSELFKSLLSILFFLRFFLLDSVVSLLFIVLFGLDHDPSLFSLYLPLFSYLKTMSN